MTSNDEIEITTDKALVDLSRASTASMKMIEMSHLTKRFGSLLKLFSNLYTGKVEIEIQPFLHIV